jgi:cobalt-zinc-cadmium resistance protein CzcA
MVLAVAAFSALGQVFLPQLDEGNLLVQALRIPATSVQQSQAMQVSIEKSSLETSRCSSFSQDRHRRTGVRPDAPNATDNFVILKDRKLCGQTPAFPRRR